MDVSRRIALCRIIEQINVNECYSKKLGIQNKSVFKGTNIIRNEKEKRNV